MKNNRNVQPIFANGAFIQYYSTGLLINVGQVTIKFDFFKHVLFTTKGSFCSTLRQS